MIPADRLVLLDTNVLVLLARGQAGGRWINEEYGLSARAERPLCSIISVGEALRIGERKGRQWGDAKRQRFRDLLTELVLIHPGRGRIVEHYARLGALLDGLASPIQQNDLWIAATAVEIGAVLLTMDRHFDRLHPDHLERIFVDQTALPRA